MRLLWEIADFVRAMRREMRFGEFSRAPLRLLRFELRGSTAACDWEVRSPDIWDTSLAGIERAHNISQQTFSDAITMRRLLLATLPTVESAVLQGFRPSGAREPPDLVIMGCIVREAPSDFFVSSLAMRAKLFGFRFCLNDEVLQPLQTQEQSDPDVLSRSNFHSMTL